MEIHQCCVQDASVRHAAERLMKEIDSKYAGMVAVSEVEYLRVFQACMFAVESGRRCTTGVPTLAHNTRSAIHAGEERAARTWISY